MGRRHTQPLSQVGHMRDDQEHMLIICTRISLSSK
jgi:hypothetical protein